MPGDWELVIIVPILKKDDATIDDNNRADTSVYSSSWQNVLNAINTYSLWIYTRHSIVPREK